MLNPMLYSKKKKKKKKKININWMKCNFFKGKTSPMCFLDDCYIFYVSFFKNIFSHFFILNSYLFCMYFSDADLRGTMFDRINYVVSSFCNLFNIFFCFSTEKKTAIKFPIYSSDVILYFSISLKDFRFKLKKEETFWSKTTEKNS